MTSWDSRGLEVLTLMAISELKRKEQGLADLYNVVWVVDLCDS